MNLAKRRERAEKVNEWIRFIADRGRHFFKYEDRYAHIEVDDRGRVWWVDEYTQKRIYTHYKGRWDNFSNGGTLKDFVGFLRDLVKNDRMILYRNVTGMASPNVWAYPPDEAEEIQQKGAELGLMAKP